MKKNYFKYKEMLKKKGDARADRANTSEKQLNQAGIAKKKV